MTEQTRTRINGVHTVAIPVADQSRALDFYTSKLGLEKRLDVPFGAGQRWIEVAPVGAGTTIALAPPGFREPGVDTGIRLTTADADADHAELRARGVHVVPPEEGYLACGMTGAGRLASVDAIATTFHAVA